MQGLTHLFVAGVGVTASLIGLPHNSPVNSPAPDTVIINGGGGNHLLEGGEVARHTYEVSHNVKVDSGGDGGIIYGTAPYVDPNGNNPCIRFRQTPINTLGIINDGGYIYAFPLCPGTAAPRPSPGEAALYAWSELVKLPKPTLKLSHERAVTGDPLTLTATGPTTLQRTYDVYGYTVTLNITSTQLADWDEHHPEPAIANGHTTDPVSTAGTATHVYIDRGTANIFLDQRWTCHWTAGGTSGTIRDRLTTTTNQQIAIEEIQAILR